jgi:hypothetical protein
LLTVGRINTRKASLHRASGEGNIWCANFYIRLPYEARTEKERFCVTQPKASVEVVGSRGHLSKLNSDVGRAEPFSSGERNRNPIPSHVLADSACCDSPKVPSVQTLRVCSSPFSLDEGKRHEHYDTSFVAGHVRAATSRTTRSCFKPQK